MEDMLRRLSLHKRPTVSCRREGYHFLQLSLWENYPHWTIGNSPDLAPAFFKNLNTQGPSEALCSLIKPKSSLRIVILLLRHLRTRILQVQKALGPDKYVYTLGYILKLLLFLSLLLMPPLDFWPFEDISAPLNLT